MKYYCLSVILIMALFAPAISAQSLDEMVDNMGTQDVPPVTQTGGEAASSEQLDADEPADNINTMRQRIIKLAESKVGTVVEKKGEDGHRVGWQHLKEIYESAYKLSSMEKDRPWWIKTIKTVGKKINDWCGIFCTWAWRRAGLPVHWDTRLIGCKYRGDTSNMGPGDLAIIKKEFNKYNHHCLIKSISGDDLVTIDGNQGADSIKIRNNRKVHHIAIYYSVADAMGATVTPTPGTQTQSGSKTGKKPKPSSGNNSGSGNAITPGTRENPPITQAPPPADKEALKKIIEELLRQIRIALPFLW